MRETATPELWDGWRSHISGDVDEDLSTVFRWVRRQATTPTQIRWATDWRTRTFCDLGLHLIYETHIRRAKSSPDDGVRIFANIQASDLQDHAQLGFFDTEVADQLSVQRFTDTWGHQPAYCRDLITYLFRPAPYLRRVDQLRPKVIDMACAMTLAELIRQTAKLEIDSVLASPLVSLHTFVETVLPNDQDVRDHVLHLRRVRLQRWASIWEQVFTAYGANIRADRDDLDWLGVAERFSTVAGGVFVRSQTRTVQASSPVDTAMLGQIVIELLPALLNIKADEIEERRLQHTIT